MGLIVGSERDRTPVNDALSVDDDAEVARAKFSRLPSWRWSGSRGCFYFFSWEEGGSAVVSRYEREMWVGGFLPPFV